jgi:hypothetical protein
VSYFLKPWPKKLSYFVDLSLISMCLGGFKKY